MHYIDHTCVEVLRSKTVRKDNSSGCTGVRKQKGKWIAQINFQKVKYYLGSFETKEEAIRVRKKAEGLLHDGSSPVSNNGKRKRTKIRHGEKAILSTCLWKGAVPRILS